MGRAATGADALGEQEHVNALMFNYDYLVVQKVPPHILQATPVRYQ